ncbi:Clavaminate synthase-like protein [Sporormia fimetaria CBS 119925]|uniref:Clavaminate synthase-like protein n=1 Tax=Sporormia fimetaria CBS 119925 TaxID=1340428 RepID=A0A6A6UZ98_9PLEO|nr:Clavaminate synthase-like protein [Sporormia fimetaria CBS 119925]
MAPSHHLEANIPVIDLSNPSPETAKEVLDAASTHGFLFIKNDGLTIPSEDIAAMFELSKAFFAQPESVKSEYAIHSDKAGGLNRGWVRMQGEALDPEGTKHGDPKEAFNIAPPIPALQPLPSPLSSHTSLITRFQTSCQTLCTTLLTHLGTALSLPNPTWFTDRHSLSSPSGTIFRMLYYPATHCTSSEDSSEKRVLAGAHSDYGSLTLLFRLPGQPGLELLTPQKTWSPVPVNPSPTTLAHPPILVNIGDLLSFWTNGLLRSTVHRVAFDGAAGNEERYSMAYFCHPVDEARLEGVPGLEKVEGEGAREELEGQRKKVTWEEGEELTAKEHLERRLGVTYGLGK